MDGLLATDWSYAAYSYLFHLGPLGNTLIPILCNRTQLISQKDKENVGLLRDAGDLVTKDMRKAQQLDAFIASSLARSTLRPSKYLWLATGSGRVRYNLWLK